MNGLTTFNSLGVFKRPAIVDTRVIFKFYGPSSNRMFAFYCIGTGQMGFQLRDNNALLHSILTTNSYLDDQWHFFMIGWDSINKTIILRVDAEKITFTDPLWLSTTIFSNGGSGSQTIACYNDDSGGGFAAYWAYYLSDIQFYSGMLSISQLNGLQKYMADRLNMSPIPWT